MDLELCINDISLQPGAPVDGGKLEDSNFRKVGLVKRLVKGLPWGHAMYIARNCTIDCFSDKLNLYPCTHRYLNKDRQWQTRATVLLVNGKVRKVDFHVVDGVYAAPNFLQTFHKICSERFGQPETIQPNHFLWRNDILRFSGFLHPDCVNADFRIETLD